MNLLTFMHNAPERRQNLAPRRLSDGIEIDSTDDVKYARQDSRFDKVAHLFHQNWHGIRAAAGVLPGHKIAIPLHAPPDRSAILRLIWRLRGLNVSKIVFHGFSQAAQKILNVLHRQGFECYLVWHGNLAQLAWEPEVHYFESAVALLRKGRFRAAHMLKAGIGEIVPNFYAPMLVNCTPIVKDKRLIPAYLGSKVMALIPADIDIRKNAHSSLLGASSSKSVDQIFYYGDIKGVDSFVTRCHRVQYRGHDEHIRFLLKMDVVVNASVVDCHPMIGLEALAAGAVDISGPLFLDVLENHPYTILKTISNPFDLREIASRLDLIRGMNNTELQMMMADYKEQLASVSISRYCDFLEL